MSWWKKRASNIKRAVAAFLGLQQTPDGKRVSTEDMKAADQIFSGLDTESQHQVELVIGHLDVGLQGMLKKSMINEALNKQVLSHLEETDRKAAALIQRFQGVSLVHYVARLVPRV